MKSKNRILHFLMAGFVWLCGVYAWAEVNVPEKPANYVVDLAGIIEPDVERSINAYLAELERKTTAQIFVLTINSLEGESLEDFSIHVAHDMWKIGQEGKDNGVLLLVSLQDRVTRFEIGYGLEHVLTDAYSKRVIEQVLLPYFRQGEYSKGIAASVSAAAEKIASSAGVSIEEGDLQTPAPLEEREPEKSTLAQKIGSVLLFLVALYLFIRHPRLFILLLMMSGGGRRGGGWGGGGGFSGGGGFGGGGGGGFGGGGASGRW